MDWNGMLTTDWAKLAEIAIRGTLMYLTIFAMLRIWRRGAAGPARRTSCSSSSSPMRHRTAWPAVTSQCPPASSSCW